MKRIRELERQIEKLTAEVARLNAEIIALRLAQPTYWPSPFYVPYQPPVIVPTIWTQPDAFPPWEITCTYDAPTVWTETGATIQ